jgi:hypothetical protein
VADYGVSCSLANQVIRHEIVRRPFLLPPRLPNFFCEVRRSVGIELFINRTGSLICTVPSLEPIGESVGPTGQSTSLLFIQYQSTALLEPQGLPHRVH